MSVESVNNVQMAQPNQKKTGGAGKAWTSAFLPGVGQLCDGRTGAGLGYMAGSMALSGAAIALNKDIYKPLMKNDFKTFEREIQKAPSKTKIIGSIAIGLASSALWIANIVDAYKGKKDSDR